MKTAKQVFEGLLMILTGMGGIVSLAPLIAGTDHPRLFAFASVLLSGVAGALMRDYWTRWN